VLGGLDDVLAPTQLVAVAVAWHMPWMVQRDLGHDNITSHHVMDIAIQYDRHIVQ
jgi:hypothetical protein